jgi:hypothetical protein
MPLIYRMLYVEYDYDAHPQIYAHTTRDVYEIVRVVEETAAISNLGHGIPVNVVATTEWPLPFYFREYNSVFFWRTFIGIPELNTPVIIADEAQRDGLAALLPPLYLRETYTIRPGVNVDVYIAKQFAPENFAQTIEP